MSTSFSRVQIRARTNKDALYNITRGTAAANKAVVTDGSTNVTGLTLTTPTLKDAINQDCVYGSAAVTAVNTTTPVAITGLSVNLTNSGTYAFYASLPTTANSAGGVLVTASGTATATSFTQTGNFGAAAANATINGTTFGTGVGTTAAIVLAELEGTIVVNTGGTFLIAGAQNASNSNTTTFAQGGFLQVTRIS